MDMEKWLDDLPVNGKYRDLAEEFKEYVRETTRDSRRDEILTQHMYLDTLLEKFLVLEFGVEKTNEILGERTNLLEKSKILYASGIIDQETFHDCKVVVSLRNKFSHNLKPDNAKLDELYESFSAYDRYLKINNELNISRGKSNYGILRSFTMDIISKYVNAKNKKNEEKS